MSENTETAILAGGCFWPAQQLLRHRTGVISTRVGYTGGENDNRPPATIPVTPRRSRSTSIPGRPPTGTSWSSSSRSTGPTLVKIVSAPRQVAEDTVAAADDSGGWPGAVVTKISQASPLWAAEAEDQDYLQRYSDGNN